MEELVITNKDFDKELTKKRIDYIDIAKGITILLMIIGHVFNIPNLLKIFIFSFHMPLFFILSGYTFNKKNQMVLIKNSFKRLIIPYLLTGFTMLLLNIILTIKRTGGLDGFEMLIRDNLLSIFFGGGGITSIPNGVKPIGAIWFLLAMFWANIIFNAFLKTKLSFIGILIVSYIGYISVKIKWLPLDIQIGMFVTIFMYVGYFIKRGKIFEKHLSLTLTILFLGIWIFTILYGKIFALLNLGLPNGFLNIFSAIVGTYFCVKISQLIERKTNKMKKWLIWLGKNTLLILCVHLIILDYLPYNRIVNIITNLGIIDFKILIFILIHIIMAIGISVILSYIPIVNKIFKGKSKQMGGKL